MNMPIRIAISLGAAVLFVSLSFAQTDAQEPGKSQIQTDPKTGRAIGAKEMTPDDLHKLVAEKAKVIIIDVRGDAEFQKETIPGAIHIPLEDLPSRLKEIPKDTALVFT